MADRGKLIETGWLSFRTMAIEKNAPQIQLDEMRVAFFSGAQHLLGALCSVLDSDSKDMTPKDEQRLNLIAKELLNFTAEQVKKSNNPMDVN